MESQEVISKTSSMDILLKYVHFTLNMCRKQSTLKAEEVPTFFKLPYIYTGYRQPNKPLKYYLYSLFQLHNETFNVWTHFGAFLVFLYMLQQYIQTMDVFNDPMSWGYLTFSAGPLAYSIFSTLAHLCHSQSAKEHYLCYQLDYMGIGLASYGTAAGTYFFAGNEGFYESCFGSIFIPSYTVLSSFVCIFLSYGNMKFSKTNPTAQTVIAVSTLLFAFIYASVPICYTFCESLHYADWSYFWTMVFPHLEYFAYFLLAGLFFGSYVPERFVQGHCDIIGQAHQIFHVLMAYYSYKQFVNLYDMYRRKSSLDLVQLSNPGWHNTLLPILTIVITNLVFIYYTDSERSRCAAKEHKKLK